jgi:hypothetical protein
MCYYTYQGKSDIELSDFYNRNIYDHGNLI